MLVFLYLSAASLIVMVVIDIILGPRAEFLNAYSVVLRMIGKTPPAGESLVAQRLGALGEFGVVLAVNLAVGGSLTVLIRLLTRI